jgi:hypothetical protein
MIEAPAGQYEFTFGGFVSRWLASLFVVFATYNPSGYSYYHWIVARTDDHLSLKVAAGVLLATGYLVAARISRAAIGTSGFVTGLVAAIFFSYGVASLVSAGGSLGAALHYVYLTALATAIAVGISWSHMKHRLTGQRTTRTVA